MVITKQIKPLDNFEVGDTVQIGNRKGIFWKSYSPKEFDCILLKDFRGYGVSENEIMSRTKRGFKSIFWVDYEMYARFETYRMVLVEKDINKKIIEYGQWDF